METANRTAPAFHGYAPPDRRAAEGFTPPLTIAISRETGSRGRSISERAAEMLGWPCINQETLEHVTQVPSLQSPMLESLPPVAVEWVERRLAELIAEGPLHANPELMPLARMILQVAAQENHVILGRGAGCVLRSDAKLYVRIVAPEKDRVAYISQMERLSLEDAQEYVRRRDRSRTEFVTSKFGRSPEDVTQYDLVINSSKLGVDGSAAVIFAAAREKEACLLHRRRH